MTAVERIEAAIQKLEALKAGSTQGPWTIARHPDYDSGVDVEYVHSEYSETSEVLVAYATSRHPEDPLLVVTLHRTIDAQLAILRGARSDVNVYGGQPVTLPAASYLADAILGDPAA